MAPLPTSGYTPTGTAYQCNFADPSGNTFTVVVSGPGGDGVPGREDLLDSAVAALQQVFVDEGYAAKPGYQQTEAIIERPF